MMKLKEVTKYYNQGQSNEFCALKQVSLSVEDGEMIAITGKSGAGKSTLLHILACVDSYEEGEYYLDDLLIKNKNDRENARIRNERLGIVMQDYALVEDFTALENVLLPLDFSKNKKKHKRKIAEDMLQEVGMLEQANKKVSCLSGGQKQRVAIARALVNQPKVILADEPTGALDSKNTEQIMELLKNLNEMGKTIVIVTHDPAVSAQCGRILEIADGQLIEAV